MYVSAKGRRELNAQIGLNGFKEVARIRRERKPLGDGEGYIGAECSRKRDLSGPGQKARLS
jgi:hypothetical protein